MNHLSSSKSCLSGLSLSFRPNAANTAPNDRMIGSIPRAAAAHQAYAPSKIKLSANKTNMCDTLILLIINLY